MFNRVLEKPAMENCLVASVCESLSLSKELLSPFFLWLSWELVVVLKGRRGQSLTSGNARLALPPQQGRLAGVREDALRSKQFNVANQLTHAAVSSASSHRR